MLFNASARMEGEAVEYSYACPAARAALDKSL